ncbi:hypothetical protein GE061_006661 [Apolygus lucorum]|uniref:Ionotropic glutamate receptor C-terminal domain-containing protein n=1 Tax=Apolygus lucorum TaxID=248454 RepID=A0A8S9WW73_APOLU|nr:hypothetical protein GE061_006661 [Apolygus lucorum]
MKLTGAWVSIAALIRLFSFSCSIPDDLFLCTYSIIAKYFTSECLCFFLESEDSTDTMQLLIERIGSERSVYSVTPRYNETIKAKTTSLPVKPYPCSYVINLSSIGSNITWYMLRGKYQHGDYIFKNESKYLIVSEVMHSKQDVFRVLMEVFSYGFVNVNFVNPEGTSINIYTLFPFGRDLKSCPETAPSLVNLATWHGNDLTECEEMYPNKVPRGPFVGCQFNISCAFFSPYLISGAGRFTGPLLGYDASPISLVSERFNVTPSWFVDVHHLWFTAYPNGSISGAIPDLLAGRGAQMACGGLSHTWGIGDSDLTMFYSWASTTWFVAAPDKAPKWKMPFLALSTWTWLSILLASIIVPSIYWIFTKTTSNSPSFTQTFLAFSAIILGNSTGPPPIPIPLRITFFCWLIYAFHVDQAYIASLTGLITTAEYEPMIETPEQLIESGMPTKAYTLHNLAELSHNSPRKDIKKLLANNIPISRPLTYYLVEISKFKNYSIMDNHLFGYDASPLSLMAERLNLTLDWTIDLSNLWYKVYPNGSVFGSIHDLTYGRGAQMSCGGLSQRWGNLGDAHATMFYSWATALWFAAAPDRSPKWKMPFLAFRGWVWFYVIAAGIVFPVIYFALARITKTSSTVSQTFLTLTALSFGNGAGPPPVPMPLRFVFFSWLFYVFHIDQAYQASLTGLITTAEYEPMMKTPQQLVKANIPTKAYVYYGLDGVHNFVKSDIKNLVKNNMPIQTSLSIELNGMSTYKNFTILENNLFVKYTVSSNPNISIYPTEVNFGEYLYSSLMLKHNYLFDRINSILYRMYDAGFPVYFLRKTVPDRFWTPVTNHTARELTLRDLAGPFYMLLIGLSTATLVFLYEIIHFEMTKKRNIKRQPKKLKIHI